MKKKNEEKINNQVSDTDNKKNLNKVKIIVCSIFLLAILVYVLYIVIALVRNPTDTFIVTNGEVSQEENVNGYIVRNETVVRGENYKNARICDYDWVKDLAMQCKEFNTSFFFFHTGSLFRKDGKIYKIPYSQGKIQAEKAGLDYQKVD